MKVFLLSVLLGASWAATTTTTSTSTALQTITSMITGTVTSTANNSIIDYTLPALPAVTSQPDCIINCFNPFGLLDPSNCDGDDLTNDCACLSAPAGVASAITGCIQTVCQSSTSQYEDIATSLYGSYCLSLYGASSISMAASAEAVSDSSAAAASSTSNSISASGPSGTSSVGATASSTAKSNSGRVAPPLLLTSLVGVAGFFYIMAL